MQEEWKKIHNCDYYEVSNFGRVRSLDKLIITKSGKIRTFKGKILKLQQSWDKNYYSVEVLNNDGKHLKPKVHRLVVEAFIPNPNN